MGFGMVPVQASGQGSVRVLAQESEQGPARALELPVTGLALKPPT